jgi:predicted nucleic acid-binding protein
VQIPRQKRKPLLKFDSYYGIPLNQAISFKAIEIMHKYISGHQTINIPDCLIAATAIITGFPLFTYNKKDFEFMDGVKLYDPKNLK